MLVKRTDKGFSLVEIMITLVIIGISLMPIYNMFSFGHKRTKTTLSEAMALNYGSDLLDYILAMPYSKIPEIPNKVPVDPAVFDTASLPTVNPPFKRIIQILKKQSQIQVNTQNIKTFEYKVIFVSVKWEENGKVRELGMASTLRVE